MSQTLFLQPRPQSFSCDAMQSYPPDANILPKLTFERAAKAGEVTMVPKDGRYLVACPCCAKAAVVHGHELACSNPACLMGAVTLPEYLVWSVPSHRKVRVMVSKILEIFPDLFADEGDATVMGAMAARITLRRQILEILAAARRRILPDPVTTTVSRLVDRVERKADHRTSWNGYSFFLTKAEVEVVVIATAKLASLEGTDVTPDLSKVADAVVTPAWISYAVPGRIRIDSLDENGELVIEAGHAWEGLWQTMPVSDKVVCCPNEHVALLATTNFANLSSDHPAVMFHADVETLDVAPAVLFRDVVCPVVPVTADEWRTIFCLDRYCHVSFMRADGKMTTLRDAFLSAIGRMSRRDDADAAIADFVRSSRPGVAALTGVRGALDELGLGHVMSTVLATRDCVPLPDGEFATVGPSGISVVRRGRNCPVANYSLDVVGAVKFGTKSGFLIRVVTGKGTFDAVLSATDMADHRNVMRRIGMEAAVRLPGFIPMVVDGGVFKEFVRQRMQTMPEDAETFDGFSFLGFDKSGYFHAPGWRVVRGRTKPESRFLVPSDDVWLSGYASVSPWHATGVWPELQDDFSVRCLFYLAGAMLRARFGLDSPPMKVNVAGTAFLTEMAQLVGQSDIEGGFRSELFGKDTNAKGWPLFVARSPRGTPFTPVFCPSGDGPRPTAEATSPTFRAAFIETVMRVADSAWLVKVSPPHLEPEAKPTLESVVAQGDEALSGMGCPWNLSSIAYPALSQMLRRVKFHDVRDHFVILVPTQQIKVKIPEGTLGSNVVTELMDISTSASYDGTHGYARVKDLMPVLTAFYGDSPNLG